MAGHGEGADGGGFGAETDDFDDESFDGESFDDPENEGRDGPINTPNTVVTPPSPPPPDLGGLADFMTALEEQNQNFLNPNFESIAAQDVNQFTQGINDELGNLRGIGSAAGVQAGERTRAIEAQIAQQQQQQGQNVDALGSRINQVDALRGQFGSGIGGLIAAQQGRAQGIDPRFDEFRQNQLAQLNANEQRQQAGQSEFFNRRGLGGSSAALNAQNRVSGGFNKQRATLTSQLGLQQLGRQDDALIQQQSLFGQQAQIGSGLIGQGAGFQNQIAGLQFQGNQFGLQGQQQIGQNQQFNSQFQSGLAGQRAGLQQTRLTGLQGALTSRNTAEQQRLQAITAGLENLTIAEQLAISRQAAETAGQSGDSGGGLFGFLNL